MYASMIKLLKLNVIYENMIYVFISQFGYKSKIDIKLLSFEDFLVYLNIK